MNATATIACGAARGVSVHELLPMWPAEMSSGVLVPAV